MKKFSLALLALTVAAAPAFAQTDNTMNGGNESPGINGSTSNPAPRLHKHKQHHHHKHMHKHTHSSTSSNPTTPVQQ